MAKIGCESACADASTNRYICGRRKCPFSEVLDPSKEVTLLHKVVDDVDADGNLKDFLAPEADGTILS